MSIMDLVTFTCLVQYVSEHTHINGHTLHLVISRSSNNIVNTVHVGPLITDHNIIHCPLNLKKPALPTLHHLPCERTAVARQTLQICMAEKKAWLATNLLKHLMTTRQSS